MRDAASALRRRASVLLAGASFLLFPQHSAGIEATRAPEFPTQDHFRWVGDPVRLHDLRGKVVLLDVWTFG